MAKLKITYSHDHLIDMPEGHETWTDDYRLSWVQGVLKTVVAEDTHIIWEVLGDAQS